MKHVNLLSIDRYTLQTFFPSLSTSLSLRHSLSLLLSLCPSLSFTLSLSRTLYLHSFLFISFPFLPSFLPSSLPPSLPLPLSQVINTLEASGREDETVSVFEEFVSSHLSAKVRECRLQDIKGQQRSYPLPFFLSGKLCWAFLGREGKGWDEKGSVREGGDGKRGKRQREEETKGMEVGEEKWRDEMVRDEKRREG